ncbi:PspC domain-containing protein [Janthinobacterium aquaticum]|uniref:PspC domain-containing protein n=1 Tax=Janthinobacterium sp. FT58W TaxID=2654254 RepID=UPI001264BCB7|nr:PspC domain-containing protein [Janthinobacterium sp. FT58W]KAB8042492.1 PspC domain-containing protein [Janthinobacterium sp. FT58W]
MNISEEIKRLHELHLAGALSDTEFAQAKAKLLAGVNLDKQGPARSTGDIGGSELVQEFNRLRRSRRDRWIGGVCGGLAQASGMEAWIWRLVFVLFTTTFGFGVVIYLLLWIFVPDEEIGITKYEH